jgi:hypothetical protein
VSAKRKSGRVTRLEDRERALHAANTILTEILTGGTVTFHDPEILQDAAFVKALITSSLEKQIELN